MADQRLRRAAEGVDGLLVRALFGGGQPFVHRPLVPDPGREAPEIDGDQEVADRVGLLGRPHPVAEDLVQEPVAPAPGAVQDDAADSLRVGERELLRDRAAHRRPDDVRLLETERLHEGGRVGREVGDLEGPVRSRRAADAAVVEGREAVAVAQAGNLVDPAGALVREPRDEEDVVAFARPARPRGRRRSR